MKNNFVIILCCSLFFSCSTKSQRDYVQLEVPPALASHPDAVEHLEDMTSQVNNIMNSLDDFVISIEGLMETVVALDTSMSKREMQKIVEKEANQMAKTYLKIFANVGFFQFKMIQGEKKQKEIENNLSGEALECFKNNCYKLRLNKDLIDQRGDEILANMERMNELLEGKKMAFEKKFGKKD